MQSLSIFMIKQEPKLDKSYGINVASLAKLPDEVIKKAEEILSTYEEKSTKKKTEVIQTSFDFSPKQEDNEAVKKIKNLDILNITPIEALNFLYEIKEKL